MLINRVSSLTGTRRSMNLDITAEQMDAWRSGELIQDAMPNLTSDQREFIMSGSTAEEWADLYPDEDDEFFEETWTGEEINLMLKPWEVKDDA